MWLKISQAKQIYRSNTKEKQIYRSNTKASNYDLSKYLKQQKSKQALLKQSASQLNTKYYGLLHASNPLSFQSN